MFLFHNNQHLSVSSITELQLGSRNGRTSVLLATSSTPTGTTQSVMSFTAAARLPTEIHSSNSKKTSNSLPSDTNFSRSAQTVDSLSVLKRFNERRSFVRSNCQKLGLWKKPLTNTQKEILKYNMIVDDKHRLLYCYLPKAACTSWKKVFQVLTGQAKSTSSISGHDAHSRDRLLFLRDLKDSVEVQKRLTTYKKLMVHREPMVRFISAYVSKFVKPDKYFVKKFGRDIIRKYRKNATQESLSTGIGVRFEEFSQFIIDSSHRALLFDGHWKPAILQCYPCSVDYNFISSMDTADDDATAILKSVGANETVTFPHDNVGKHGSDVRQYYSKLPRTVVQKLIDIYRMDFAMFGYKKPKVDDLVVK